MLNKKLKILEELVDLSFFEEEKTTILWTKFLEKKQLNQVDQKEIRAWLAKTSHFPDCTAISIKLWL